VETRAAIASTFARREKHPSPPDLPAPPVSWTKEFAALAREACLGTTELSAAFNLLNRFYQSLH
jgi:hypothetical protein